MYEIEYSEKAERFLDKLDHKERERIINALERIRIRPEHFIEKLVGEEGFKFRVGNYRAFLDLDNGKLIILVLEIGHRKNVYKK